MILLRKPANESSGDVEVATLPTLAHHDEAQPVRRIAAMQSLSPNLPPDKQREMLRRMLTIRRFEERASPGSTCRSTL